jgi:hypothetical protein
MNPLMMSDIVYYIFGILVDTRRCIAVCHLWRRIFLLHPDYEIWRKWKRGKSSLRNHILRHGSFKTLQLINTPFLATDVKSIVANHDINIVKYVLSRTYEYYIIHDGFVFDAARHGRFEIMKHLINIVEKFTAWDCLFRIAVGRGHLEIIKYILSVKGKTYIYPVIIEAIKHNHFEVFKYLSKNIDRDIIVQLIIVAARYDRFEIAKYIADVSKDIIAYHHYVIVNVVKYNRIDIMKHLVNLGVDVTMCDNRLIRRIRFGDRKNSEMVEYLIEQKADISVLDHRPLILAFNKNNFEMIKVLIAAGADVMAIHRRIVRGVKAVFYSFERNWGF